MDFNAELRRDAEKDRWAALMDANCRRAEPRMTRISRILDRKIGVEQEGTEETEREPGNRRKTGTPVGF